MGQPLRGGVVVAVSLFEDPFPAVSLIYVHSSGDVSRQARNRPPIDLKLVAALFPKIQPSRKRDVLDRQPV
jgi:hypothetical protein